MFGCDVPGMNRSFLFSRLVFCGTSLTNNDRWTVWTLLRAKALRASPALI
jgi:hypothetical protein